MFSEAALRIELERAGKRSVIDVQYDRALIGSGAHCDVRLAPDEAAVEQLVVELVGDDEVYAQARALDPVCLLNGAPFLEGRLAPSALLELGGVALSVTRTARQGSAPERKRQSKSATSPAVQALGILGVIIGLYVVLSHDDTAGSLGTAPVALPPMAAVVPEACPQPQPQAAAALAEQWLLDAENKRERSPFYAGDGVAAVAMFERAAACFASAGARARADEAHRAALELHARVADELHLRHVRLERYVSSGNYIDARHEAQLLAELVPDKSGSYAAWLSAVKREGELRSRPGQLP